MKLVQKIYALLSQLTNRFLHFPETNSKLWNKSISPVYVKVNTVKGFSNWHQSCNQNTGNNPNI